MLNEHDENLDFLDLMSWQLIRMSLWILMFFTTCLIEFAIEMTANQPVEIDAAHAAANTLKKITLILAALEFFKSILCNRCIGPQLPHPHLLFHRSPTPTPNTPTTILPLVRNDNLHRRNG